MPFPISGHRRRTIEQLDRTDVSWDDEPEDDDWDLADPAAVPPIWEPDDSELEPEPGQEDFWIEPDDDAW